MNARVKHGSCRNGRQIFCEPIYEVRRRGVFDQKNQARFGAELPDAQRDGLREAGGNFLASFRKGAGQDDQRIQAAHLRVNGDGDGTRRREIEKNPAGPAGAREADGLSSGIFHQRLADG